MNLKTKLHILYNHIQDGSTTKKTQEIRMGLY